MWPVCHVSTSFAARDAVQSGCCALMTMTHIMSTTPRDCACMPWHYCYCLPHISLQVSGYIDYAQRLAADPSAEGYFLRTRRMLPRPSDLSYYNWETQLSTSNPTSTWQVCLAHHALPMRLWYHRLCITCTTTLLPQYHLVLVVAYHHHLFHTAHHTHVMLSCCSDASATATVATICGRHFLSPAHPLLVARSSLMSAWDCCSSTSETARSCELILLFPAPEITPPAASLTLRSTIRWCCMTMSHAAATEQSFDVVTRARGGSWAARLERQLTALA